MTWIKQICIADGVNQACELGRAISNIPTPSAPFIFALLPTIDKFVCFVLLQYLTCLHPELAPNVQKNDDANERERGHEHLGRSDLQTRAVVGVKLQDVLSATGPAAATGRCCASLCWSLLRPRDSRKQAYAIHSSTDDK